MDGFEAWFATYGLAAVFLLMFAKSAGAPIPVPGDIVMLALAARVAQSSVILWQAFFVVLVALVTGGFLQYLLARGPARSLIYRFGRYSGLTPTRLDTLSRLVQRRGPMAIGLAIFLPGLRAGAVAACGLARVPPLTFLPGLTLGSALFLGVHFTLGYVGAASLQRITVTPPLVLGGVLFLFLLLAAAFLVWRALRQRRLAASGVSETNLDAFGDWQDAACPACLVLGAASQRLLHPPPGKVAKEPTGS